MKIELRSYNELRGHEIGAWYWMITRQDTGTYKLTWPRPDQDKCESSWGCHSFKPCNQFYVHHADWLIYDIFRSATKVPSKHTLSEETAHSAMYPHLNKLWTVFIQLDWCLRWWYTVELAVSSESVHSHKNIEWTRIRFDMELLPQKYTMYPWSLQANLFIGGQCTCAIDLCNTLNKKKQKKNETNQVKLKRPRLHWTNKPTLTTLTKNS